jgi:Uncharacterized conserved protein
MRFSGPFALAGGGRGVHIQGNGYFTGRKQAMTTFDDRENAYENKFAHDAELQFKADARCNKMLGEWAAGLLGKTGAEAEAYVVSVVKSDFEEAGHEDVFRKLSADLGEKADEATIRAKMAECMAEARRQVVEEAE